MVSSPSNSGLLSGMTELSAHRIIVAVEAIAVCAITYVVLALTREYFGREALWALGLAGLALALFSLFRLRK
jgi:hypothetical protein